MKYQIYNVRTKDNVGNPMSTRKRAQNKRDKLNYQYGECLYGIKEVAA